MAFRCPSCDQPLYNRRRKTCESCGVVLPSHLLLNAQQQQRLDEQRQREVKEHRAFMESDSPPMGYGDSSGPIII